MPRYSSWEVHKYSSPVAYLQFTIFLLGYTKLSYTRTDQELQVWIRAETYWAHNINDWGQSSLVFCVIEPCLFTDKRPQFVQIDSRTELLVSLQVIVSHAYFSKVTRVTVKETHSSLDHIFHHPKQAGLQINTGTSILPHQSNQNFTLYLYLY